MTHRTIGFIVALVLLSLLGVVTASAVMPQDDTAPEPQQNLQSAPGSHANGATTPNPGGGPPWALWTYRSQDGSRCAMLGPKAGSRVGLLGRDATVRPFRVEEVGSCLAPSALSEGRPAELHRTARRTDSGFVTLFWGWTGPDATHATVGPAGQAPKTTLVDASKTFALAFEGHVLGPVNVGIEMTSGVTREIQLDEVPSVVRERILNPQRSADEAAEAGRSDDQANGDGAPARER